MPSPGNSTLKGVPEAVVAVENNNVPLAPPSLTTTVPVAEPGVTKRLLKRVLPLKAVAVADTYVLLMSVCIVIINLL
jgi:hypothetical protein